MYEYESNNESVGESLEAERAPKDGNRKRTNPAIGLSLAAVALALIILFLASAVALGALAFVLIDDVNDFSEPAQSFSVSEIAKRGYAYTVSIEAESVTSTGVTISTGTGVIITENGYIATNNHIISDAQSLTVYLMNGKKYGAKVIATDPATDLALLRIHPVDGESFTPAVIGALKNVEIGDRVVLIGTPGGIEYAGTVSVGYVSYIGRNVGGVPMIQTDASANHGNSGGPMINESGEVIGILTSRLNGDYNDINFAIPISEYMSFFEAEIENDMAKPQLGVTGAAVVGGNRYFVAGNTVYTVYNDGAGDYVYVDYYNVYNLTKEESELVIDVPRSGFMIMGISASSDANGKLRVYDIITEFDGVALINDAENDPYDTVIGILATKKASDVVTVKFLREGIEYGVELSLSVKE